MDSQTYFKEPTERTLHQPNRATIPLPQGWGSGPSPPLRISLTPWPGMSFIATFAAMRQPRFRDNPRSRIALYSLRAGSRSTLSTCRQSGSGRKPLDLAFYIANRAGRQSRSCMDRGATFDTPVLEMACIACLPPMPRMLLRNKLDAIAFHAVAGEGVMLNPRAAARRFRAAMLRWRCCCS